MKRGFAAQFDGPSCPSFCRAVALTEEARSLKSVDGLAPSKLEERRRKLKSKPDPPYSSIYEKNSSTPQLIHNPKIIKSIRKLTISYLKKLYFNIYRMLPKL